MMLAQSQTRYCLELTRGFLVQKFLVIWARSGWRATSHNRLYVLPR